MSDDAAIELAKMLGLKIEVKKEKVTHKKSICRICKEEFTMYGHYDRFCGSCKSTDFYRLDHSYSLGTL